MIQFDFSWKKSRRFVQNIFAMVGIGTTLWLGYSLVISWMNSPADIVVPVVDSMAATASDLNEIKVIMYFIAVSLTLILGSIQFYFNRKHQKNTYSINMLNNTLSLVHQSTTGEVNSIYKELKTDLYKLGKDGFLWSTDKTIKDVVDVTATKDEKTKDDLELKVDVEFRVKANTYSLLNFYDAMATSMEDKLIEPGMIFNHYSLMVIDMYRWSKPLIDEQSANDDFSPWQPFVLMAKVYIQHQDMLQDDLNNHKNSIFMKQVIRVN